MTHFDFFDLAAELPVPAVTAEQARAITRDHFGLESTASELGSQQDANFLLRDAHGQAPAGVLEIARLRPA